MTVALDLQKKLSAHRRYFLRIDGLNKNLAEDVRHPDQTESEPISAGVGSPKYIVAAAAEDDIRVSTDGETWTLDTSTGTGSTHGIHGRTTSDIWMTADSEEMHHYDGSAWSFTDIGGLSNISDVAVIAADDVYATSAGTNPDVFHYNGTSWSSVAGVPGSGLVNFWGIWAIDASNIFVVGAESGDFNNGKIYHYDGVSTWTTQLDHTSAEGGFRAVWGTASNNVYAVGDSANSFAKIFKYNGSSWSLISTATYPRTTAALHDVEGFDDDNIWVLAGNRTGGEPNDEGLIWYWNGSTWSEPWENGSATTHLLALTVLAADEMYAVGIGGQIIKYNGSTYTAKTSGTSATLNGVYGTDVGGGWDRNNLNCLRVPEVEYHQALNLGKVDSQWSSMAFKLVDVADPDDATKSFFGQLFAPGRWDRSGTKTTYTVKPDVDSTQIDSNSNAIYVKNNDQFTNMATSGELHIAQETFSYTGKTTESSTNYSANATIGKITGVLKGLYPSIASPRGASTNAFGQTYVFKESKVSDPRSYPGLPISTVPYSWLGRMVGLYVTTYDDASKAWNMDGDAELVWSGRISDSISYDPDDGAWSLQCESLTSSLDREIASRLPAANLARVINLNGESGRSFVVVETERSSKDIVSFCTVTVAKGYYDSDILYNAILGELNDPANWTDEGGIHDDKTSWGTLFVETGENGYQQRAIQVDNTQTTADRDNYKYFFNSYNAVTGLWHDAETPHCMRALGFVFPSGISIQVLNNTGYLAPTEPSYRQYHPIATKYNGGLMAVQEVGGDPLISDQGDGDGTAVAYFRITEDITDQTKGGEWYIDAYSAKTEKTITLGTTGTIGEYDLEITELTLATSGNPLQFRPPNLIFSDKTAFVGSQDPDGEYAKVENLYRPTPYNAENERIGPFTHLLQSLVSTGVAGYNGTYDVLDARFAVQLPSGIVDEQSFIDADNHIGSLYPILFVRDWRYFDKSISWRSWFLEEGGLFGVALVWESGKIGCKRIFDIDPAQQLLTLDETNSAMADDYPGVLMATDTVINRYAIETGFNPFTEKYELNINVNDVNSQAGLAMRKEVKIRNGGLFLFGNGGVVTKQILEQQLFSERFWMLRGENQKISRTLAPDLYNRIFVGDVVGVQHSYKHPDPFGSGANTVNALGTVLDVSWNLKTGMGQCTVLIWSRWDHNKMVPWAPAALVDIRESNGGLDDTADELILVDRYYGNRDTTDNHDGEAFVAGDKILVIERDRDEPTSTGNSWQLTVASAGYDTATGVLAFDTATLTGWTSSTEHVVLFDDYGTATTAQKTNRGLWAADADTQLIAGADDGLRFG